MAAVSKPKLTVGKTGGSSKINFTVDVTINWDEVSGGNSWALYVLIIERDGKTDIFDVRADGTVYWNTQGLSDDWVVWVPLQMNRPPGGGSKDYSFTWKKSENSVGKDLASKEEFKARVWLVPDGVKRHASSWSSEVSIGL